MFNYSTETLTGTTYYSTQDERGNVTTVFEMCGTMFAQVNRSPARAVEDIKKLSVAAANLLLVAVK